MNTKKTIALILMVVFMGLSSLPLTAYAGGTHHNGTHKEKVFKKHVYRQTKRTGPKRHVRRHAKKQVRRHVRKHHAN